MEEFFPKEFISGSITSQEELDGVFLKYPKLAKPYIAIALAKPDIREWYEKQWPIVKEFLDKDFLAKFKTEDEYIARSWEFHLASVFKKYNLPLQEKTWDTGPDFCIVTTGGKKIWIEAIACTLGTIDPVAPMPDMLPGVLYDFGGNIEDINRPRALRITNAIATKLEKYKKYQDDAVSKDDCLMIAVSGQAIQHHSEPNMLFKYAVFGQGPDVLVKVPGRDKLQEGYYKPIPIIIKHTENKQQDIPPHFMEMEEFTSIGAVIYSGNSAYNSWMNDYNIGDDFLFAYHINPANPIPEDLFKFGTEIRKNITTSTISSKQQN